MSQENGQQLKRVCLGMPGYGDLTPGAMKGVWRATKGPAANVPLDLGFKYNEGSLLAQNFNALWCWALNECHHGNPVDYFAMLHSDVEPDDFWLDTLIEEMEVRELDVLGVVVPIKDPKGLTSIALAREDGDNWSPLCRLTMAEIFELPETFTSEDTGHDILLNTGCWVCRFNPEWTRQVHFAVNDRIIFNRARDLFMAQVEPEDWYFSRLCHELELRIGATRKVGVEHAGHMRFTNRQPWGSETFDRTYVAESALPSGDMPNFRFPRDVDGWLTPEEGRALAVLSEGKRVLEIGSYCGKSTICIAQTAREVVSTDYHDGRGTPNPRNTLNELKRNLATYGVFDKVEHVRPDGELLGPLYDLVFIDGAHDLESVQRDIALSRFHLKSNGLLAFHDYRTSPGEHDGRYDPGVTEAVNELLANGGELISRHGTIAVVRPPCREPVGV